MNTLTVELFAVGKWNGMTFALNDLKEIANNFDHLKNVHFAPVKLGHNEEQPKTDGEPALGEITKVWVGNGKDGEPKLMGTLSGLPDVVYKAIKKKLYNKVSIELDRAVKYKGRFMNYVLTAVALLGADLPAVNTLADLNSYMSRKSLFTDNSNKLCFSQDTLTLTSGVLTMDEIEKLKLKFSIQGDVSEFIQSLLDDKTKAEEAVATFKRDEEKRIKDEAAAKVTTCRNDITAMFEKAVADKVIAPAQREQFTKLLNVDDDTVVVNIDKAEVEKLLSTEGDSAMFSKGSSKSDKTGDTRTTPDAGEELTAKAYDLMNSNTGMSFDVAFSRVLKANPDLAKEHLANEAVAAA